MTKEKVKPSEYEMPANSESLSLYIRDIANFPVFDKEIESIFFHNLAKKTPIDELQAQKQLKTLINKLEPEEQERYTYLFQGVKDVYEAIFLSNVKLVISRAKRFYIPGMELVELIQYGNIALHKSIMNFDVKKNIRFSTYAVRAIDSHLWREIRQNSNQIRIPENSMIALRKIDTILKENNLDENDDNTIQLLVQETKVSRVYLATLLKYRRLNETSTGRFNEELDSKDIISSNAITKRSLDEIIIQKEMREIILTAIDSLNLPQRDKDISKAYIRGKLQDYHGETTYETIGNQFGLTRQRIEQIIKQTYSDIRNNLAIKQIYDALNDE